MAGLLIPPAERMPPYADIAWRYARVMTWWGKNLRVWSGPMFPLLIMQLVICAGFVIVNGVGLIIREFDVSRTVLVIAFGMLLVWLLATLVGVVRLRAIERSAKGDASGPRAGGGNST